MITLFRSLACWLCVALFIADATYAQTNNSAQAAELSIALSEQRIRFAPTRSFLEMRLEVVNSLGETVFIHATSEAEFDWNLRASNGETLAPGLYRYALTIKFSEELSRQHRGHFIVEKSQDQIWLTASEGAEVSGTALNAARNSGRSIAGLRTAESPSVKRDVSGREIVDETGNKLTDGKDGKKARQEKAALLATGNQLAKFAADNVTLIDSTVTETGGNVGIGTTTPGSILEMVRPGATDVVFRMANATRAWSVGVSGTGDFWRIRDNTTGAARLAISGINGNVGIGTTAPSTSLTIDANANGLGETAPALLVQGNGNKERIELRSANADPSKVWPVVQGKGFGGTLATPTQTKQGMILNGLAASGHDGTQLVATPKGLLTLRASQDWTPASTPTNVIFETTEVNSLARLERMRLTHEGYLGIGTSDPLERLEVAGKLKLTGTGNGVIFPDGSLQTTAVSGGSGAFIQNGTTLQASANFNIFGDGTVGGTIKGNIVNATTQYNLDGYRILSTPGIRNLLLGVFAGSATPPGRENVVIGEAAGQALAGGAIICTNCGPDGSNHYSGSHNLFAGYRAGISNTTGYYNTFSGYRAGFSNTAGRGNTFSGSYAGYFNTTGDDNTFSGYSAGESNTTGFSNTFSGRVAGGSNTTGNNNTISGSAAGYHNTTGNNNTFSGNAAGNLNTTGNNNTFSGSYAGRDNTTGSHNTVLGYNAQVGSTNTNATAIGYIAYADCSNCMVLGSINGVYGSTVDIKVGIGTTNPKTSLDVAKGHIHLSTGGRGVILKSSDGLTCRLLALANTGELALVPMACP